MADFNPDAHPRDKDGKFAALGGSAGGHDAQVASAKVSAKGSNPMLYVAPTIDRMALDHQKFSDTIGLFSDTKNYPGLRIDTFTGTVREQAQKIVDTITSNLLAVFHSATDAIRDEGMRWYQSAHNIAQGLADKYKTPLASIVGCIAKLSPNKDWNMNVEEAKQMVRINAEMQNHRWDDEMQKTSDKIWTVKGEGGKPPDMTLKKNIDKKADYDTMVSHIQGKKLSEIKDTFEQGAWIRTYAQAHLKDPDTMPGQPGYRKKYPDGFQTFPKFMPDGSEGPRVRGKDGSLAAMVWQSRDNMGDALTCLKSGGNPSIISEALGDGHKVRSFYNNILDPMSPNKDSTIDTHEVGAAWIRDLGASSLPVAHNFGNDVGKNKDAFGNKSEAAGSSSVTGIVGTYPVYHDAHTATADKLGILPQQLQAVAWVQKKEMFDGLRKEASAKIDSTWDDYRNGKLDLGQAQQQAIKIAADDKAARVQEAADEESARQAKQAARDQAKADKAAAKEAKLRAKGSKQGKLPL